MVVVNRTVTAAPGTGTTAPELRLVVTDIAETAPLIKSFTVAAADGAPLPGFVAGSHLLVRAGDRTNAYSLTSDGVAPTEYTISVLRVADGAGGSRVLHDSVEVGDTLAARPPCSAFPPIARASGHLLVAGGIGITPMVSHLRAARRWGRTVRVLYTYRPGRDAHSGEVLDLAGPAAELFDSGAAFRARLPAVLTTQPLGTHLYICGPAAMIDHVTATARGAGWPESRIHAERFGAGTLDPGEPFTVTLTESDRTIPVPTGTSLLEALEAGGVRVPSRCRQGVCGECVIPLRGGTPIHRDLYLGDHEKAAAIMPCVSRAARGTTLEVPL
ncbi:PDR/VanB family oxidoreductase [Nocardia sp. NPDC001965]